VKRKRRGQGSGPEYIELLESTIVRLLDDIEQLHEIVKKDQNRLASIKAITDALGRYRKRPISYSAPATPFSNKARKFREAVLKTQATRARDIDEPARQV
jgi:hypothetical protein